MKKMSIREFSARVGVTAGTVRKWESSGKLQPIRTTGGHRRYTEDDVRAVTRRKAGSERTYAEKRNVIYCRVSHPEQADELIRQAEKMEMFALGRGLKAEIVTEIGCGKDMTRPKLMKVISGILGGEIGKLLVSSSNRLMHSGFELLESISKECGCEIITVSGVRN